MSNQIFLLILNWFYCANYKNCIIIQFSNYLLTLTIFINFSIFTIFKQNNDCEIINQMLCPKRLFYELIIVFQYYVDFGYESENLYN